MEELLGALMQAGMTRDQADRVVQAVSFLIDARVIEHIHAAEISKPKARKPSKKPQARRRWKK